MKSFLLICENPIKMLIQIIRGILEAQSKDYFVSKHLSFSVRKLWDALNLSVFDLNLLHFQFLEEVFDEYFT